MEIIAIFPPYIYSIKYDDKEKNEFDRLFDEWNDLASVLDFLMQHKDMLKASVWKKVSSPGLKDHVIQNIDKVRTWLKENGIMDADDMEND